MRLPDVEARIRQLANSGAYIIEPYVRAELRRLADEIPRRKSERKKAPATRKGLASLAPEQIKRARFLLATTDWSEQDIADDIGTNPGRINELKLGKRE